MAELGIQAQVGSIHSPRLSGLGVKLWLGLRALSVLGTGIRSESATQIHHIFFSHQALEAERLEN